MKPALILSLLLLIFSCQQNKQKKPLLTEDFKYTSFTFRFAADSFELYVHQFINIDNMGHYILMKRDLLGTPKYFSGSISDSIRDLMNKTFLIAHYQTNWSIDITSGVLYCGPSYCFDYKKTGSARNRILFLHNHGTKEMIQLSCLLDTFIDTASFNRINSFDLSKYKNELREFSISVNPLPPPPKILKPKIKFHHWN